MSADTTVQNSSQDELENMAYENYVNVAQPLVQEILEYADTTTNGGIRITMAFRACTEGYREFGFAQCVSELAKGSSVHEAALKVEKEFEGTAKAAALGLIKALRAEGFTTKDINDFSDDLKKSNEQARLMGQANALRHYREGSVS